MSKLNVSSDDINITEKTGTEKKRNEYIKQIKNPYKIKCRGLTVSISFNGDKTLEDKILDYLEKEL